MVDVTPKTPLGFGQSPLTGRIYTIRGNRREDVTEEFRRFMGNAQDAKPDHLPDASKMVSDRERRLESTIRRIIESTMSSPSVEEVLDDIRSIARAALAEAQGGEG